LKTFAHLSRMKKHFRVGGSAGNPEGRGFAFAQTIAALVELNQRLNLAEVLPSLQNLADTPTPTVTVENCSWRIEEHAYGAFVGN
jgi:hypothetical protein